MATPASLQFLKFDVSKVIFNRLTNFNGGDFDVNVEQTTQVNDSDKNHFQAVFIVSISVKDEPSIFSLQVQAVGEFRIHGEIEPAVYANYQNISAPSIVYPYIRAFISNLVMQTGMTPIILPPLNFSARPEPKKDEELKG